MYQNHNTNNTIYGTLTRTETGDQGTFGRLSILGFKSFTAELPWRDNRTGISCIPAGTYEVAWRLSPRFKRKTYWFKSVPGRSGVLIHAANLMGDTEKGFKAQLQGCIALGERLGYLGGQKAILVSMPAMRNFETLLNGRPFMLEIRNKWEA